MRASPKKHSSAEEMYTAALRGLMRRAYSVHEMRTYLERRATDASLALKIVARLKHEKLIDDGRYALEFARAWARLRRQGRHRIIRELRLRGVPDRHVEAAIDQVFAETDEAALVRKVIERRLRLLRGPLDQKKFASLYRMLLRAGFDAGLIRRELRAAPHGEAADELPDSIPQDDA